jgi:hypothetical protein
MNAAPGNINPIFHGVRLSDYKVSSKFEVPDHCSCEPTA